MSIIFSSSLYSLFVGGAIAFTFSAIYRLTEMRTRSQS